MAERPILFNDEMVRAILDGRKTQTRRPVNSGIVEFIGGAGQRSDPAAWGFEDSDGCFHVLDQSEKPWRGSGYGQSGEAYAITCPFGQPGDTLWVRESFKIVDNAEAELQYRADGSRFRQLSSPSSWWRGEPPFDERWRPSIHMPRWASRITLRVTDVRVERVQDISGNDAMDEGTFPCRPGYHDTNKVIDAFVKAWNSIYAAKGLGWEANPWAWAVTFEVAGVKRG